MRIVLLLGVERHTAYFIDNALRTVRALRFAIGDSSLSQIVRGQLNRYAVARYNSDEMLPHLPGDVSYNLMAVFKFDSKLSTRQGLNDGARKLDDFLINCHKYNLPIIAEFTAYCKVFLLLS